MKTINEIQAILKANESVKNDTDLICGTTGKNPIIPECVILGFKDYNNATCLETISKLLSDNNLESERIEQVLFIRYKIDK